MASVATAALPFVVALAGHPDRGASVTLVELLVSLARTATEAEPAQVDERRHEAWRLHCPGFRALLAGPRPEVRRAALVVRATLRTVREYDRRLSMYRDYRAFLQDEEIRSAIDDVPALP
ncbi:hypothetical protein ACWEWI_09340 [Streptomyces sp. NPDC003753]